MILTWSYVKGRLNMIVRLSVVLRIGLLVTVIDVSTNCAEVIISVKVKTGLEINFFVREPAGD